MVDEKTKSAACGKLSAYLKERNLRNTPERMAILERVLSLPEMFAIDEVRALLFASSYHVSEATLYNTLNVLCDCGVLYKHYFSGNISRYQRVPLTGNSRYQYLVCESCSRIKLVKDPEFTSYMNTKRYSAFTAGRFNLYVYGTCNSCLRKQKKVK